MSSDQARRLWEGNRLYVEYMGDDLPIDEARYLAQRQDDLYLAAFMAIEIRDTPVLRGEDARRFEMEIKENENKSITKDEYNRAVEAFKMFEIEQGLLIVKK